MSRERSVLFFIHTMEVNGLQNYLVTNISHKCITLCSTERNVGNQPVLVTIDFNYMEEKQRDISQNTFFYVPQRKKNLQGWNNKRVSK